MGQAHRGIGRCVSMGDSLIPSPNDYRVGFSTHRAHYNLQISAMHQTVGATAAMEAGIADRP